MRITVTPRISGPRSLIALALVLLTAACSVQGGGGQASGDDYPSKPVEIVVGASAGGSTDIQARALAKSLEEPLGEKVIVTNKPGANGKIAGKDVLSSTPDGYRLMLFPQSLFAIGPLFLDDPDAITLDDMTFIKGLAVEDYVLVTSSKSRFRTLKDVTGADKITYGTTGPGTGSELATALLLGTAGVKGTAVPFDGGAPALTATLGGKVDVAALQIAEATEQVETGGVRALAVFAEERIDAFPDTPTATEAGYEVVVDQRRFLAGPAGLPDSVVDTLVAAVDKATATPEYKDTMKSRHIGAWDASGEEARAQVEASAKRFADLVQRLGIDLKSRA